MYELQINLANYEDVNWIDFFVLLNKLSKSLRKKDSEQITENLISCIHDVLCFAKQNDIDMNSSWARWYHKMDYKTYS